MESVLQRLQATTGEIGAMASERVVQLLPEALTAIAVLFIGWLVAVLVHFLTVRILGFFAIDKLAAKTPLEGMLKSVGIRRSVSDILARLLFWLAILIALVVAADILHLEQVANALTVVTRYIPQVIAALLIVIFGMLLAKFLQMLATQALSRMGIGYERGIGKAVQVIVLIFVTFAAMEQLGFDIDHVMSAFIMITAALLLIFGLGLALGARTVLDNWTACHELRNQISIGDTVAVSGTEGEVSAFTLTGVVVESEGKRVVIPATTFLTTSYTLHSHS